MPMRLFALIHVCRYAYVFNLATHHGPKSQQDTSKTLQIIYCKYVNISGEGKSHT